MTHRPLPSARRSPTGPAALARERAACEADGIPLDPRSLQPPVPPDQDAAPLWKKWETLQHDHLLLPNYAETLRFGYAYTPEQLARVQKIFDDNRAAMDALCQATDKPALSATVGNFGYYSDLREASRELKSESFLLAHQGQSAAAIADQARGFQIAKQITFRSTLVNYLVGNAIEAITLSGMRDILYLSGPNADVSAQVQRAIQTERPVLSLKSAFAGETAYSLSRLEAMRSWTPADLAGLAQENTIYAHSSPPVKIKAFTPDERRFVDNLMDASDAIYLSQMRQLVNAADLSRSARHAAFAAIQNVSDQPSTNPINELNPIMEMSELVLFMYKSDGKMEDWDNRIHAQEEVTLAGAALLAAKARTGAFPDALSGAFTDPFTGKPLNYRREGDSGFVVYSVGTEGKFDGGKPGQYEFHPSQAFFRYPGPTPRPVPPDMLK